LDCSDTVTSYRLAQFAEMLFQRSAVGYQFLFETITNGQDALLSPRACVPGQRRCPLLETSSSSSPHVNSLVGTAHRERSRPESYIAAPNPGTLRRPANVPSE